MYAQYNKYRSLSFSHTEKKTAVKPPALHGPGNARTKHYLSIHSSNGAVLIEPNRNNPVTIPIRVSIRSGTASILILSRFLALQPSHYIQEVVFLYCYWCRNSGLGLIAFDFEILKTIVKNRFRFT